MTIFKINLPKPTFLIRQCFKKYFIIFTNISIAFKKCKIKATTE